MKHVFYKKYTKLTYDQMRYLLKTELVVVPKHHHGDLVKYLLLQLHGDEKVRIYYLMFEAQVKAMAFQVTLQINSNFVKKNMKIQTNKE